MRLAIAFSHQQCPLFPPFFRGDSFHTCTYAKHVAPPVSSHWFRSKAARPTEWLAHYTDDRSGGLHVTCRGVLGSSQANACDLNSALSAWCKVGSVNVEKRSWRHADWDWDSLCDRKHKTQVRSQCFRSLLRGLASTPFNQCLLSHSSPCEAGGQRSGCKLPFICRKEMYSAIWATQIHHRYHEGVLSFIYFGNWFTCWIIPLNVFRGHGANHTWAFLKCMMGFAACAASNPDRIVFWARCGPTCLI